MKRLLLILGFCAICLFVWAQPVDTCKIEVVRTERGFEIKAVSGQVYIREGNDRDATNYIFVTNPILEIICNDTTDVSLNQGYQEGIVSCWSQDEAKQAKEDRDAWHSLNRYHRRNWIKLDQLNISTDVTLYLTGEGQLKEKVNIRYCGKYSLDSLNLVYSTDKGHGSDLSIPVPDLSSNNTVTAETLSLKADETLTCFSIERDKLKEILKVDSIMLDGQSLPFTVDCKGSKTQNDDDIMFATDIIPDSLLHKVLIGGRHQVSYKCLVLTKDGPRELTINVPIEVEHINWLLYIILAVLGIMLLSSAWFFLMMNKGKEGEGDSESPNDDANNGDDEEDGVIKGKNKAKGKNKGQNEAKAESPLTDDKGPGPSKEPALRGKDPEKPKEKSFLHIFFNALFKKSKKNPSTDDAPASKLISKPEGEDPNAGSSGTSEPDSIGQNPTDVRSSEVVEEQPPKVDQEAIKKQARKEIIELWNKEHPDNQVNRNQMTIDALFATIDKGYIGQVENNKIEQKKKELNATSIDDLFTALRNVGMQEGANITKETTKQELSDKCNKLEQTNKELSDKCNKLEQTKQELSDKCNKLEQTKKELSDECNGQKDKIKELEDENRNLNDQVDAQSASHITELENQIKKLKTDISAANEDISEHKSKFNEKEKELEKLIKNKENLESKFNVTKQQLDEAEDRHREIINSLKEEHKAAKLKLTESFEAKLSAKDQEKAQLIKDHEVAMNEKQVAFEGALDKLKEEKDNYIQQLVDDQNEKVKKLNADHEAAISQLNATINELSISANASRNEMISKTDEILMAIRDQLDKLEASVNGVAAQSPIFVSIVRNIITDLGYTREAFDYHKKEDWNAPDKKQSQVIADLQNIFINALGRSGWINNVARLLSYSRLPLLQDGTDLPSLLEAHGISSALLESIYAQLSSLLGIADMGLIVPAVLANAYNRDCYDYTNGDIWINKFFPEVSIRNYKGKVFDIVQVGFVINGKTERKPDVQYN